VAADTLQAARDLAQEGTLKLSDIERLTEQCAAGDLRAADRLADYKANSATVLRGTVALMEQQQATYENGDPVHPEASELLPRVLPATADASLRYVYAHRRDIARGQGVTPEMAKFIAYYRPSTGVQERMVAQLEDVLTDAAFTHFGVPARVPTTVGHTEGNVRVVHVRTANQIRDPNVPDFVREAYLDDLSEARVDDAMSPRQAETIIANTESHMDRMYTYAKEITDVQALPTRHPKAKREFESPREKYERVMQWGRDRARQQRQEATVQRVGRVTGPVRRAASRIFSPGSEWR
jgi:hypothetical protein